MLIATISMGEPLGNFFLTAIYAAICGGGQRSFCKYANYFFKAASSNFLSNRFNWCRLFTFIITTLNLCHFFASSWWQKSPIRKKRAAVVV